MYIPWYSIIHLNTIIDHHIQVLQKCTQRIVDYAKECNTSRSAVVGFGSHPTHRPPSHGHWENPCENDRPFSDNPTAAVFFSLRISTKHGVDYRDWVGKFSRGLHGETWWDSMDSSHQEDLFMIERKNLDIRIQYLVAEHFFRKSWWISHIFFFQNPATTNYDHIITFQAIF